MKKWTLVISIGIAMAVPQAWGGGGGGEGSAISGFSGSPSSGGSGSAVGGSGSIFGGGSSPIGGGGGLSDQYELGVVTDPNSDLTLFAWDPTTGDSLGILGTKDGSGQPVKMTGAVIVNGAGEGATVMLGDDGLPRLVAYSDGIQMELVEYGPDYVDAVVYLTDGTDFETRLDVDPGELAELKSLSKQVNTGKADGFGDAFTAIKLSGWVLSVGACTLGVVAAVASHGVATPLAVKWCAPLAVKIAAAAANKYLAEGTGVAVGSFQCASAVMQGPVGVLDASGCVTTAAEAAEEIMAWNDNPCEHVNCGSDETCIDGDCVYDGPSDPCAYVYCDDDETCVDGDCIYDGPSDPCAYVYCDSDEVCIDGDCIYDGPSDPCDNVYCDSDETCVDGDCVYVGGGDSSSCADLGQCCSGHDDSCTTDSGCFCDEYCVEIDDCCSDACSECGWC